MIKKIVSTLVIAIYCLSVLPAQAKGRGHYKGRGQENQQKWKARAYPNIFSSLRDCEKYAQNRAKKEGTTLTNNATRANTTTPMPSQQRSDNQTDLLGSTKRSDNQTDLLGSTKRSDNQINNPSCHRFFQQNDHSPNTLCKNGVCDSSIWVMLGLVVTVAGTLIICKTCRHPSRPRHRGMIVTNPKNEEVSV